MALETWFLFLFVSILPAISPGPAILLSVSNTLRFGPKATLYSATGNALGLVLLSFGVSFGLAALFAASATAFFVVKLIGAAYLIFLGVKLWRDRQLFAVSDAPGLQARPSAFRFLLEAFLVSITNPKAIFVLIALLPPFIDARAPLLPQVVVLSLSYAGLCFVNHLLLAYAGGWLRKVLHRPRHMTYLRRGLGVLFIGFGAKLATLSR